MGDHLLVGHDNIKPENEGQHRILHTIASILPTDSGASIYLQRYQHRQRYLVAMLIGPTPIVRDQAPHRCLSYTPHMWSILDRSDDWCIEFLRFRRKEICELAVLLQIPERFDNRYRAPPTTALAVVCYWLSWP